MSDPIFPAAPTPPPSGSTHQLEDKRNFIRSGRSSSSAESDPKLGSVCREMESLFINYLLKEMRATIDKSGLIDGGQAEEIYTSMLDAELAKEIAGRGGIGLYKLLWDQLAGESGKENRSVTKT
jgi:flagellar protein FlgJ